jgi:hypothetical protein
MVEDWKFLETVMIIPYKHDKISLLPFTIPVFNHSIIPGWKKKNGWVAIPYYQAFLEIPIYLIIWLQVPGPGKSMEVRNEPHTVQFGPGPVQPGPPAVLFGPAPVLCGPAAVLKRPTMVLPGPLPFLIGPHTVLCGPQSVLLKPRSVLHEPVTRKRDTTRKRDRQSNQLSSILKSCHFFSLHF